MITKNPTYFWYAIYTKSKCEKKILATLQDKDIECYLPLHKTLHHWSDRKKWIEEPLFRCYLFVKVSNIEFHKVLSTNGVVCYISFGGIPQTIPDYQIQNVKTFVKQQELELVITRERIARGIHVEVNHGTLKGVKGEVVQICGHSRLLVRIESLGCSLYANISIDEIKLVNANYSERNIKSHYARHRASVPVP